MLKRLNKLSKKFLSNSKGMSLIEILIVITLIGLAGSFIAGKVFDSLAEGERDSAKIQIRNLMDRLNEFKRHCGMYPSTDQGLEALVNKPTSGKECKNYRPGGYIEGGKVPKDPWDENFIYQSNDGGRTYVITTLSRDRAEGGEGYDADIRSDEL